MKKVCNIVLMLTLMFESLVCSSREMARFIVKQKKMSEGVARFCRPIYVDDQYFNIADDDSYDSWEPTKLMRDSARLFAYPKAWGTSFNSESTKSWYCPSRSLCQSVEPAVTWIGHSTCFIQFKKLNIITDPIFGSPSWFYKRANNPGISANRLPHIDIILLSHNHSDHMDEDSLMALRKHQPFVMVPQGNARWFKENGFNYVQEYTWWERQDIQLKEDSASVTITCVPSVHWSGRSFLDTNATLWSGWVISSDNESIYFAGDTGYSKRQFDEIRTLFPSIKLALLPIGPNEPNHLMGGMHLSAGQAVEAFQDLDAQWLIPIHWGTFKLGADTFMMPVDRLKKAWQDNKLPDDRLHILKCGQRAVYNESV